MATGKSADNTSTPVLLLTVGTGDLDKLQETLLVPLAKSIRKGRWSRVILLPSHVTASNAAKLRAELPDDRIDIRPLPKKDQENDVDACFGHFDDVICELREDGCRAGDILADFTRGTKAMSAALVLAALRHDLPRLRYISGRRDSRGMVIPGTEQVEEIPTTIATARRRLDDALAFFRRGQFAAVLTTLPDPNSAFARIWPEDLLAMAGFVRPMAEFYSAWDWLDYEAAHRVDLPVRGPRRSEWDRFRPSEAVRKWIGKLASQPSKNYDERADQLRRLAADLLANARRRIRDRQYEDALLRAYRILELMGQIRLVTHGLDSDRIPCDHPAARKLADGPSRSRGPGGQSRETLSLSRENQVKLLEILRDPFARRLTRLAHTGVVQPKRRNYSVLVHGFSAVGGRDARGLQETLDALEEVFLDEAGPQGREWLRLAATMDFAE